MDIDVKTSELIGEALDWMIAKVEGRLSQDTTGRGRGLCKPYCYSPSTLWIQGGPLIEKYNIGFGLYEDCILAITGHNEFAGSAYGKTHLIAACRAIVHAKLGETVSIPAELLK